jgi:hypothetical protein
LFVLRPKAPVTKGSSLLPPFFKKYCAQCPVIHTFFFTKFNEQQLTKIIITCCVTQQIDQARTTELHRIIQEPGQPVQGLLASLKSKGRQCNMKLVCSSSTCELVNEFSEPVIKSLFIAGLNDMELQQDLLAEPALPLEKAVTMAVATETAKSSQVIFYCNQQVIAGLSTYKKGLKKFKVLPDCCFNCGQKIISAAAASQDTSETFACMMANRNTTREEENKKQRKLKTKPRQRLGTASTSPASASSWRRTSPQITRSRSTQSLQQRYSPGCHV